MKLVVLGCLCAGVLATAGCGDERAVPTSPSASAAAGTVATSLPASPRSGDLLVTKECGPGPFCTITSSNVQAIEVDSRILYLQPDRLFTPSGSDVVLDPPGPGNNKAFGNCSLAKGVCTFTRGTGKFTGFEASVDVTANDDFTIWYWKGTYSFGPQD